MTVLFRHPLLFLAVAVDVFAVALFAGGYAVGFYRHAQTFEDHRQEQRQVQKIQKEMQEDLSRYSRASAAHIEAQRGVAALSDDLSSVEAGLKEEYIVRREKELEGEKKEALQDVRKYMEEVP